MKLEDGLAFTSAALALAELRWGEDNPTLTVRDANPACYALTGTPDADALAQFLTGTLNAQSSASASLPDRLALAGEPVEIEHEFERADGRRVHVMLELSAAGPVEDGVIPTMVYLKNITPGRTLQRQLRWLSALPEANPNIVLIVSESDEIEYVNATGRAWLEERNSDSWDDLRVLVPAGPTEDASDEGEQRRWSVTHDDRTYEVRRTPLAEPNSWMITVNDVTTLVALTRQHEIFYRAFQSAHTPMMVTDPDGRIEYVNSHFEKLYGYPADTILGKTPSVVNPGREAYYELGYSDEDYDELFREMWTAISDPEVGFWERDIPNRTADGRLVWVRMLIHAVRNDENTITSYIGFPVDMTDSRDNEFRLRLEAYEAISDLAELRDNETGNHIKRVGRYAMELARRLGHSRKFQEELLNFAPLHDIGKVGIPDEILLAPRRLTDAEYETMKRHTVLGYELFRSRPSLETAASIAQYHHERWDGTGYPHGLAGEDIPLCARIVSVCDVYDALRSERPYKAPWSHDDTVSFIGSGRGTQFDPEVVDAFLSCHDCIDGIHSALPDE